MKQFFEIEVEQQFSAAHRLRGSGAKCENLHGHNWNVVAVVRGERLDRLGMVMDFKVLRQALLDVLEELDHRDLNALPAFEKVNPSAENIARFVYDRLARKIVARGVRLERIRVAESDGCWATYGRQG